MKVGDLNTALSLGYQRIRENIWVMNSGLLFLMALGFLRKLTGQRGRAVIALSQVHRTTRSQWMKAFVAPYIIANRDAVYMDHGNSADSDITTFFGNRFLVLKAPGPNDEKGVLLVMFTEMIRLLRSRMNLPKLLQNYTLVFEPSWSGYCDPGLLQYTQFPEEIFVLSAEANDFAFLQKLGSNLIPVALGPCDWVDPRVAIPHLGKPKEFDIVMNSNWAPWKRHYVLFRMLKRATRRYRVALIGGKWGGKTGEDIEHLADFYGVRAQLKIMERLSYDEVMDITCRSRVSILLSLKEGSNRAIAESIFCNVPVVVLANHVGGIKKNVVPQTGILAQENQLAPAVDTLLSGSFCPRDWALDNISCFASSSKLNSLLRDHALASGRAWTQDIAGRSNSPESTYIYDADSERLRSWNQDLKNYLKDA